ncbi:MAG: hypothetical protein OEX02_14535 [Cyclobacteriaceae bacterium]|nr:hypothetical protein [Cyclobacteriaceae bacterium]
MRKKTFIILIGFLIQFGATAQEKLCLKPDNLIDADTITLGAGNLSAVFVNNNAYGPRHRVGYSGIAELHHTAQDSSPFVPEYAGINYEHVMSGIVPDDIFEPRRPPMYLARDGDDGVFLYQKPTPQSKVESITHFKLVAPHYIDFTFRFVIHDMAYYPHDYAGIFWASYIDTPKDKKIYFKGIEGNNNEEKWIASYSESHGDKSTHKSLEDKHNFFFADDFPISLANHFSDYRYTQPFYYGLFHNMAFAFLFESSEGIRFSQSPTGGGEHNPAWDFQYLVPDVQPGKEYAFRARFIYKPFAGDMDIQKEFQEWKRTLD